MSGALSYLSMNTRSDIAYAVGLLSCLGSKPTLSTCHPITYLMQYVRGTVSKGACFTCIYIQMRTGPVIY